MHLGAEVCLIKDKFKLKIRLEKKIQFHIAMHSNRAVMWTTHVILDFLVATLNNGTEIDEVNF